MTQATTLSSWCRKATLTLAVVVAVSGCGELTSGTTETDALGTESATSIQISLSNETREKHDGSPANIPTNLLDLSGSWHSWANESSSIHFDPQTDSLHIAKPSDESGVAFGVRRYDLPLTEGNWYALSVTANSDDAAAIIFLFDTDGKITAATTDANGHLILATNTAPMSFTAPANIAGFYVQVQSGYQATQESQIAAQITTVDSADPKPDATGEHIEIEHIWSHWNGDPGSVTYDSGSDRLRIEATGEDGGIAIAAQRLGFGLVAGQAYELSALQATDPTASVLVFLFNQQHQVIPFAANSTQSLWLAASAQNPQRFVAPPGVTDVGIQVQSGYQPTSTSYLVPSLRAIGTPDTPPNLTPVTPPQPPVPERPVPPPPNE